MNWGTLGLTLVAAIWLQGEMRDGSRRIASTGERRSDLWFGVVGSITSCGDQDQGRSGVRDVVKSDVEER
jgi:hypothetical protein